ncbi:MAG: Zn-dependent hydrolase [Chitinophagaceae bacterium]|nr:Zn-dependent hydrolase [Chitinophagaceae bacterium]
MKLNSFFLLNTVSALVFISCNNADTSNKQPNNTVDIMEQRVNELAPVKLTTDLTRLTESEKKIIPLLIDAAHIMDTLFAYQAYGNLDSLLNATTNPNTKKFIEINYGPWDRLRSDSPFVEGIGPKPSGANFYPTDMSKVEFEEANLNDKTGLYNFIRRDETGKLYTLPFHEKFKQPLERAATKLREAAAMAEDPGFKKYLMLRADALLHDDYQKSDFAWLDMKNNGLDIVIGPIETYEDQLFGYKASYEGYVLVKDKDWSSRLAKYAAFLPELQDSLPVSSEYKTEKPGSDGDLNAYDVIYYAGSANAGGKTIAINLPNDEEVQLKKGTRRLQLKNAMQAKFDKIMVPIANVLITPDQRQNVKFDAFFANTMFHEVAHGLGIKNTINGKGTVRKALKEYASALEEGKADILGLFMVEQLLAKGEMTGDLKDYYTTFIAGIFRSVRFGAGDAHGIANMIRFNYFQEHNAFTRQSDGTYKVNYENMKSAIDSLSNLILTLQGNGDYEAVAKLVAEKGKIGNQLQKDLDRLGEVNIPVDVIFEQGVQVLGLQ